jgi:hypothetical protein
MPGEIEERSCGYCGTQLRICGMDYHWGDWGSCFGQGVCAPGTVETRPCGNGGQKTRICSDICSWNSWSECEGEMTVEIDAWPQSGDAPLTVYFSADIEGGKAPYSYGWDFGTGITSGHAGPTYKYWEEGDYTVTLEVTDSKGITATDSTTISVGPEPSPEPEAEGELMIKYLWIDEEEILPGDQAMLSMTYHNSGDEDLKDLRTQVFIHELGIVEEVKNSYLKKGRDISNYVFFEIPEGTKPGLYDIMLIVTDEKNEVRRIKFIDFRVV